MYIVMNSEQVEDLLWEKRMSARDLAAAAGLSRKTITRVECGEPVRVGTARKVAAALGVDPPQKLGRTVH